MDKRERLEEWPIPAKEATEEKVAFALVVDLIRDI